MRSSLSGLLGAILVLLTLDNRPLLVAGQDSSAFGWKDITFFDEFHEKQWKDGVIWFDIDPNLSPRVVSAIYYVVNYVNQLPNLCVKWLQRYPYKFDSNIKDYISFVDFMDTKKNPVCSVIVNRSGGQQGLRLGPYCIILRLTDVRGNLVLESAILHEMFHAMGLEHEHQRPDRDCFMYVASSLGNDRGAYGIINGSEILSGFPYDYNSITHYTVTRSEFHVHDDPNREIGRVNATMSELDLHKLSSLYCGRKTYCEEHDSCASFYDYAKTNPRCWRKGPEYN
uniref:Metalloendopeptidase n=1 Tax=Graphocephala atropunctata TaxID=36148 RepID=A0A1B6LKH9_9HEMI